MKKKQMLKYDQSFEFNSINSNLVLILIKI